MSIHTLNGLSTTSNLVEACLQDSQYDLSNGSVVVPINGTCIEAALSYDQTQLQDKQQVSYFALHVTSLKVSVV